MKRRIWAWLIIMFILEAYDKMVEEYEQEGGNNWKSDHNCILNEVSIL